MSKMLRVLVTFAAAVLVLLLLFVIGFVVFVNPNDLKPQISQAVSKYTGRHLQLAGNIEWSIFPWLGLQLNDAQLSNAPGFGQQPFAKVKKLAIQVRLSPLLHKQLEINKLHIQGLTVHLIKNRKGQVNWNLPASPLPSAAIRVESPNFSPLGFIIAGIHIQNGQFLFEDQQANKRYLLSQLQLKSDNLAAGRSSPLVAQFNLIANSPKLDAAVKLKTDIAVGSENGLVSLSKLSLSVSPKDPKATNSQLPILLLGDVNLNLYSQRAASKWFVLMLAHHRFTGYFTGDHLLTEPSLSGVLSAEQFQLDRFLMQNLQLPFRFQNNILSLNSITGQLYRGSYLGDATLNLTTKPMRLTARSHVTRLDAQSLLEALTKTSQLRFAGLADINFDYTTQGNDADALLQNLKGQGQFSVNSGAIKGIDLPYWFALGRSLLEHTQEPVAHHRAETLFSKLSASFKINNGLLTNDDLVIRSGTLNVTGRGSINLPQQQIRYRLQAQSIRADGTPDSIAIPIQIMGSLTKLIVVPDVSSLGLALARETLRHKLQRHLQNLDLKKYFHPSQD